MRLYFSGGLILTVFRFFVRLLFLLITPYAAWAQSGWNNDAGDRTLVEMERAYARKQSARLTQLLPASSGHPLEDYAAYWAKTATVRILRANTRCSACATMPRCAAGPHALAC